MKTYTEEPIVRFGRELEQAEIYMSFTKLKYKSSSFFSIKSKSSVC